MKLFPTTQAEPSTLARPGGWSRLWQNQTLQAILVLNIVLLIFFSTPLLTPNSVWMPADLLQRYDDKLIGVEPTPSKYSPFVADGLKQFYPYFSYNLERLAKGQFPMWNPYNSNGMPHFANLQSAVLSPFNIPVYLFGLKDGWFISKYLTYLALGLFCYGYLRLLNIWHWVALSAAIAFMFTGNYLLWATNVAPGASLLLPGGFFFIELAFKATTARRQTLSLGGLSLTIALNIFAGHPESIFWSMFTVSCYILFRLWLAKRTSLRQGLRKTTVFLVFGLLGVGLSSVQLLPFLEYLILFWADRKALSDLHLSPDTMIVNLIPTIFGYDTQPFVAIPGLNFENISLYIGAAFIFLTFIGSVFIFRNKFYWFFVFIILLFTTYCYNLFPFNLGLSQLPFLSQGVAQRSGVEVDFGLSCATALVLNHFYQRGLKLRTTLFVGLAAIAFALATLGLTYLSLLHFKVDLNDNALQNYVPGQLLYFGIVFGLAIVGALLLGQAKWRGVAAGLLIIASFAQSGFIYKDFNGTSDARYYFSVTPGIQALQQIVGANYIAFYKDTFLAPSANLMYQLHDVRFYDAVWLPNYNRLLKTLFDTDDYLPFNRNLKKISPNALKLTGVQYVVSTAPPDAFSGKLEDPTAQSFAFPLLNSPVEQSFVAEENNLASIRLLTATYGRFRANTCSLQFTLVESDNNQLVRAGKRLCADLPEYDYYSLNFEPIAGSKAKTYRFSIWSPDSSGIPGTPDINFGALYQSYKPLPNRSDYRINGVSIGGADLIMQPLYANPASPYRLVWTDNRFSIYHFEQALPRYYTVGRIIPAATEAEVLELLIRPNFDPAQAVILGGPNLPQLSSEESSPVRLGQDKPEYKHLIVQRQTPGFLATSLAYYPGWQARVNGADVAIIKTNSVFIGIPVPAGESRIELYYDPLSFKLGLLISGFSLLILVGLVGWAWNEDKARYYLGKSP